MNNNNEEFDFSILSTIDKKKVLDLINSSDKKYEQNNNKKKDNDNIIFELNSMDIEEAMNLFSNENNNLNNLNNINYQISYEKNFPNQIKDYFIITDIQENTQYRKKFTACKYKEYFSSDPKPIYSSAITISLEGDWSSTLISLNNKIFFSGKYNYQKKSYFLTNNVSQFKFSKNNIDKFLDSYIIVEPEIILSATQIKNGYDCVRREIINHNFRTIFTIDNSKNIIIGKIIHDLFELELSKKSFNEELSRDELDVDINQIIKNYYIDIALIREKEENILNECKLFYNTITNFYNTYCYRKENFYDKSTNTEYISKFIEKNKGSKLKIEEYISSEKKFVAIELGIGGIFDVLVKFNNDDYIFEGPLEIKSGNKYDNNNVQVALYCLILSNLFFINNNNLNNKLKKDSCEKGVLIYLKDNIYPIIEFNIGDLIQVISIRNEIAYYYKKFNEISYNDNKLINDFDDKKFFCKKETCFKRDVCILHQQLIEEFNEDNNYDDEIKNYFKKYYCLIGKEEYFYIHKEQKIKKKLSNINFYEFNLNKIYINEYSYILELYKEKLNESDIFFEKYELYEEFYIFLNNNNLKFVLYDKDFNKNIIFLQILKNKLDEESEKILSSLQLNSKILLKKVGKYSKSSYKLERGNLFTFISNPLKSKIISNLQQIILYNKKPQILNNIEQNYLYAFISNNFPEINQLNNDQINALKKCLFAKDYALIQGYPGSGKTFFISILVKILYKLNKKIFITAHTNIAVDNILERLIEFNIPFLRISNPYNKDIINEKIKSYTIDYQKFLNVDEVKNFLNKKIYAGTELSIYSEIIKFREFDYVIIDEASQSRELEILGPLMIGEKFILVGDQNQLGAIYKSIPFNDAPKSLFQRLYERNNSNSNSILKLQYRMNKEILNLSNSYLYNNLMKCANKEIEDRKLNINLSKINKLWIRQILDPEKPIFFCDYYNDNLKDELNKIEDYNLYEANLIVEIIKNLRDIFNYNEIGVITLYKAQEELIKKCLKKYFFYNIFTIDKCQGIEKEIIIISFCKANEKSVLLQDINRINVAFTRAKTKLIIIGIKNILKNFIILKDYINKLDEKKLIYNFDFNLLDLNNINNEDNIINELKLINKD